MTETRQKRTTKETREAAPERVPVGGFRDRLGVKGTDPKFHYRWVRDADHNGQRIIEFTDAGYSFVQSDEVTVGQTRVLKTENIGDIVREPAGEGEFLYLMKQPMEYFEEDQAQKAQMVDSTEDSLHAPEAMQADPEGYYGELKITNNKRR